MKCSALIRIGVVWLVSSGVWAASQYWDISDAAGLPHGSGSWSLSNAYWSPSVAETTGTVTWDAGRQNITLGNNMAGEVTNNRLVLAGPNAVLTNVASFYIIGPFRLTVTASSVIFG